jgi:hypothetical protein
MMALRRIPNVSPLRLFMADPRKTRWVRKIRSHISLGLIWCVLSVGAAAQLALPAHDHIVEATLDRARASALLDFESSYKDRLLQHKETLSQACTSWWFGMTHKDRKLDPSSVGKKSRK